MCFLHILGGDRAGKVNSFRKIIFHIEVDYLLPFRRLHFNYVTRHTCGFKTCWGHQYIYGGHNLPHPVGIGWLAKLGVDQSPPHPYAQKRSCVAI